MNISHEMNVTPYHPMNTTEDKNVEMDDLGEQPTRIISFILIPLVLSSNAMSLIAILSIKGRLSSHFFFLVSLAFSDILVAISSCIFSINEIVNPVSAVGFGRPKIRLLTWCSLVTLKALNTTGLLVTLLSLMGMSIDAYIAMLRPSYYLSQRNRTRSGIAVVLLWIMAFICGFSDLIFSSYGFVVKMPHMSNRYNYCEFAYISLYQDEYIVFAMVLLCMVTMSYLYCRIYAFVRRRSRSVTAQSSSTRERKVLVTTIVILVTFGVCFVPMCALNISLVIHATIDEEWLLRHQEALRITEKHLFNLFLLNGVIDPIVYTIRIPEVQQAFRKFMCRNNKSAPRAEFSHRMTRSTMGEEMNLVNVVKKTNTHSPYLHRLV